MSDATLPRYVDTFPFAHTEEGLQFLLLQRTQTNTYPGIWQPAAGKIKAGETAWQAGLRELQEETGFTPLNFYALDHVGTYYLHKEDRIIQVPSFLAEVPFQSPTLNHEHDAFAWGTLETAVDLASWEPYRQALHSIPKLLNTAPALAQAKIRL